MYEGLDPKYRRRNRPAAYFGKCAKDCERYAGGGDGLVVCAIFGWDGSTRRDGGFGAQEVNVLPIGVYKDVRNRYGFCNIISGLKKSELYGQPSELMESSEGTNVETSAND